LANYSRANELDQYVIDRWPQDVQAMWAKMDMAKTDIALGNYAAADKTVDILIADFRDQPELPETLFLIVEQYYTQAFRNQNEGLDVDAKVNLRKALSLCDRIVTQFPQSLTAPRACRFAADSCRRLGEYDKAVEYCRTALDRWPDYKYADRTKVMMDRCLEELQKQMANR
jgi:tetratricopeptide (TPR) repeat protein